jgi:hypothetical protein
MDDDELNDSQGALVLQRVQGAVCCILVVVGNLVPFYSMNIGSSTGVHFSFTQKYPKLVVEFSFTG